MEHQMFYNTNNLRVKVLKTTKGYILYVKKNTWVGIYNPITKAMPRLQVEAVLAKHSLKVDWVNISNDYREVQAITRVDMDRATRHSKLVIDLDVALELKN